MEIKCDKCSALVNEVKPEQIRDGDIEHTYFRCLGCGAVYPVAVTDAALRKDIAGYSWLRQIPHVQNTEIKGRAETGDFGQQIVKVISGSSRSRNTQSMTYSAKNY